MGPLDDTPIAFVVPSYKRPTALRELDDFYAERGAFDSMNACVSGGEYDVPVSWDAVHWEERQIGLGEARNRAMALAYKALGENAVYYLADDDILLPWGGVIEMLGYMVAHPDVGVAMPTCEALWDNKYLRHTEPGTWKEHTCPYRATFIRGAVVKAIGYHDPWLAFKEDSDYAIRAYAAGFKIGTVKVLKENEYKKHPTIGTYGGTELPIGSEKRTMKNFEWARHLCRRYPFSDTTIDGRFTWIREFRKLPVKEQREWALYFPPLPEKETA